MLKNTQIFHVEAFIAYGIASIVSNIQDLLDSAPIHEVSSAIILIADKARSLSDYGRYHERWQQSIDRFTALRNRILYDDDEPSDDDLRDFARREFPVIRNMAETIMQSALDHGMEESCTYLHTPEEVEMLVREYLAAHSLL